MSVLRGWLRVALRDLKGDLRRFSILLACLALGVATIALVGSVGAALQSALTDNARLLLGGDLQARLSYRSATADELALFDGLGEVTASIEVMGRAAKGDNTAFLALRGVDDTYPLVGTAEIDAADDRSLIDRLNLPDGRFGVVPDTLLLDRLGLSVGDSVTIGKAEFEITGTIRHLPDTLNANFQFGIPALLSNEGVLATGILGPGILARYSYSIVLRDGDFATAAATIRREFPQAGWQVAAPDDATTELSRFFTIFSRFLIIVGLSSLLVGGVGVSSAISAYITDRQRSIATLKALGATSRRILVHFLTQVLLISVVGILLGLILGAILTLIALPLIANLVGLRLSIVIDLPSLATAAGFGLLTALAFGYLPLWRAQKLRPALLFRSAGSAVEGGLRLSDYIRPQLWVPLLAAGGAIYWLALITTKRADVVFWYTIGALIGFVLLRLAAFLLQAGLRRLPPLPNALWRNAVKSIHRPGAPAPIVVLSLGLGLALLLLIALIDANLRHQLDRESIPNAPSFAFIDLFDDEVQSLKDWSAARKDVESFEPVPMLRGLMTAINGTAIADRDPQPSPEMLALIADEIPITYSAQVPDYSTVGSGTWWPADYSGTPLVSVSSRYRDQLGVKLGDTLTFQVSGIDIVATIANFRDFVWRDGTVNFSFVFSPNAFADLPVSSLGLLKVTPGAERQVQKDLVAEFPDLVFLPTSEAVATFANILQSITTAVESIGGLAVLSGALVLAGALLAGRRQREADAVVMKVLGAQRGDIVRAYVIEYAVLGLLATALASALALVGTWAFVTHVLEIDVYVDAGLIALVAIGTVVLTVIVGTLATWSALSAKPATFLREE